MVVRRQTAFLAYGVLTAVAAVWGVLSGHPNLLVHPAPWFRLSTWDGALLSAALGLGVAIVTIMATRWLLKRAAWTQALHEELFPLFRGMTTGDLAWLALLSGISEELFFRGAMSPTLGYVVSSLVFGLVHIGPNRRFVPWTIWALVMGCVFGAMYVGTGSLAGPVLAHVLINFQNMKLIADTRPGPGSGTGPAPPRSYELPRLVGGVRAKADRETAR